MGRTSWWLVEDSKGGEGTRKKDEDAARIIGLRALSGRSPLIESDPCTSIVETNTCAFTRKDPPPPQDDRTTTVMIDTYHDFLPALSVNRSTLFFVHPTQGKLSISDFLKEDE